MTNPTTPTDDTADVKLTKREEAHVKELERFAADLEKTNLLYGSALDGMAPGLESASRALADTDLASKMTEAEQDNLAVAERTLKDDIDDMTALDGELDDDDAEEQALLAEDEAGPR